ncbi:hypothetical protein BaRGS_00039539 [Batillaria attramentaria]|uniref:Uncharacterized protein n=1 Tax=Batillaria attramentaria TaxID=370345 RepID=A0ABD0J356_9CAEN
MRIRLLRQFELKTEDKTHLHSQLSPSLLVVTVSRLGRGGLSHNAAVWRTCQLLNTGVATLTALPLQDSSGLPPLSLSLSPSISPPVVQSFG